MNQFHAFVLITPTNTVSCIRQYTIQHPPLQIANEIKQQLPAQNQFATSRFPDWPSNGPLSQVENVQKIAITPTPYIYLPDNRTNLRLGGTHADVSYFLYIRPRGS